MLTRLTSRGVRRLGSERGFTLIELLIVLVIIAILLAIAVPAYLGFRQRAEEAVAKSNIREAVPAIEAYYVDNGTYVGATLPALRAIDPGMASVTMSGLAVNSYTASYTQGNCWASITGPGGSITSNC